MTRVLREFFAFAREEGRWWLLPIGGVLAIVSVFATASSGPLAPFVYAMF